MATQLHIQPLDPGRHDRAGFDCGVTELNCYLSEQARKEVAAGAATCFVATWEESASEIADEKFGFEALDERRLYLPMQSVKELLNAR